LGCPIGVIAPLAERMKALSPLLPPEKPVIAPASLIARASL
jgi:hypothetical protein